jgi:hypothetical protein
LKSLHINLHEEEQVDLVIRTLMNLEYLNGLKVERDELDTGYADEEGEEVDESQDNRNNNEVDNSNVN